MPARAFPDQSDQAGQAEQTAQTAQAVKKCITLLVPVLNEEESIDLFYERMQPVVASLTQDVEFLFVDDGSTDRTLAKIAALHMQDPRVKPISFSRNFGKEVALAAGFRAAQGDAVIPMDVDLQDPPDIVPLFVQKWEEGYDTVIGVRCDRRKDTFFKRKTAGLFYRWFNKVSPHHLVDNAGDFRLLDRKCVDALNCMGEHVRFTKALYSWVGFRQATVDYVRPERAAGTSKWNAWKLWNFALDGITSFSSLPLRVWSYLGGCIALLGFAYAAWLVVRTLVMGVDVQGWASLMVVTLTLGGLILLSLGIIGEYLGRIFEEVKKRPLYIVRSCIGVDEARLREQDQREANLHTFL